MALTMTEIITQADILVPNVESTANKAIWLNDINRQFFKVVKIPQTSAFTTIAGTAAYSGLNTAIRARNIDKVQIQNSMFPSFLHEDVPPGHNYHLFDDAGTLTLSVAPKQSSLPGIIRWYRIATTTYTTLNLSLNPDAPDEFHDLYIPGLAYKIAEAIEDLTKKNNYKSAFDDGLLVAQANFK